MCYVQDSLTARVKFTDILALLLQMFSINNETENTLISNYF